jgi:hypothetical protein
VDISKTRLTIFVFIFRPHDSRVAVTTYNQELSQPARKARHIRPKTGVSFPSLAFAACIVALSTGAQSVQAKQCNASAPSDQHGQWWSYRLIDGRKCWYEGKPMLSKSSLEWPKASSEQSSPAAQVMPAAETATNPLDAQAWAPEEAENFEARWRARVQEELYQ